MLDIKLRCRIWKARLKFEAWMSNSDVEFWRRYNAINIEHAGSELNIRENSKQEYATQWSEKWKKCVFTHYHKYPRERYRVMKACLMTSLIKMCFHWFLKSRPDFGLANFCLQLASAIQCASSLGPVARSLVSANGWLTGIETYKFPWYLTLVSANRATWAW